MTHDFSGNPPAERVQAYIDAAREQMPTHDILGAGYFGERGKLMLTASDIHDVLGELAALQRVVEAHAARRAGAAAALAGWYEAVEGDSGDAELEAGSELADVLAATFEIEIDGG